MLVHIGADSLIVTLWLSEVVNDHPNCNLDFQHCKLYKCIHRIHWEDFKIFFGLFNQNFKYTFLKALLSYSMTLVLKSLEGRQGLSNLAIAMYSGLFCLNFLWEICLIGKLQRCMVSEEPKREEIFISISKKNHMILILPTMLAKGVRYRPRSST